MVNRLQIKLEVIIEKRIEAMEDGLELSNVNNILSLVEMYKSMFEENRSDEYMKRIQDSCDKYL